MGGLLGASGVGLRVKGRGRGWVEGLGGSSDSFSGGVAFRVAGLWGLFD